MAPGPTRGPGLVLLLGALLACVWPASCNSDESPPQQPSAPIAQPKAGGANAVPAQAAESKPGSVVKPAPPTQAGSATLRFRAQEGWVSETPAGGNRKAQYRLPKVEGDAEDASLIAYFFGASGGTVEHNMERWLTQLEQPDGGDSRAQARISTESLGELPVHRFDCSGTYVAETTPGSGQRVNKPGFRMLALVVVAAEGPYYLKLVGPAKTVERWLPSFEQFRLQLVP